MLVQLHRDYLLQLHHQINLILPFVLYTVAKGVIVAIAKCDAPMS